MYRITALCLIAFTLQVKCQNYVAQVYMENVNTTVTFRQSGPDVIGSFGMGTGLTGTVNIAIHPLWFHYDVDDKCATSQLGADITNLITTSTYPADFTLSSTTLDNIEGKSLVLQNSGKTACASIQKEGDYITAAAYLRETIFGDIFFRQHSVSGSTFINTDLKTAEGFTEASWFVAKGNVDCDNIGDPTQIDMFNPDNVEASCSQDDHANCALGNLFGKLGSVQVASESSSDRASFTDTNLPLSGDKSIAGKYLIVYDRNNVQKVACTKIDKFKQRNAYSIFSHSGATGRFEFSQRSPFDPTLISVHLEGLGSQAGGYHVHDFPVPLKTVADDNLCHSDVVAGHLNPYSISVANSYPDPLSATDDLYETGDLSSKYGTLADLTEYGPVDLMDWNLPLFGRNSIVGRSIVIHRNDVGASRWVCSNIELDGPVISASAVLTAPVIGHVYFTQTVDNPETRIFVRVDYFDGREPTTAHHWQISTDKVGRGMDCDSAGMLYNPNGIWNDDNHYDMKCSTDNRLCKLGDMSGRLGVIAVGKTSAYDRTAKEFYTDSAVRLSGPNSLIGRSVVIMNSSGSPFACATIQNLHDLKLSAQFDEGNLKGKVIFTQKAGFGQIPTVVSVKNLNQFNKDSHGLEIRTHPIASGNDPCANLGNVYDPFNMTESSPRTDDQYKIGDLSRRGSREMWNDVNLPLKGPTSVMGHSLAILNQNNIVACANIGFDFDKHDGYMVAAKLDFSGPVVGDIKISQIIYDDETLSDTSIVVDLEMKDDTATNNHNWHVHQHPVAGDATVESGRCSSAGPHYDPFRTKIGDALTDYNAQCGIRTPLRCEVGDQAKKLGTYDLGSGAHVYNDVYLPLEGEYSVQGRSIVVHIEGRGAPRLACADIIPMNGLKVSASFDTPQNFDKRSAARVFANAIGTHEENIVVEVVSQTDDETKVNIHFLGKSRSLLMSQFTNFIDDSTNRQSLGDYSSITLLSKAGHIISSVVVLLLSLVIGKLLSTA